MFKSKLTGHSRHITCCVLLLLGVLQVFAEKMGLETGWNCHISLTPNGDSPCDGAPSSPSHGSLHEDLNQGRKTASEVEVLQINRTNVSGFSNEQV